MRQHLTMNPQNKMKNLSEDESRTLTQKLECKVCSKSYDSLLKHLNQVENCKIEYSVEEIDTLKELSKKRTSLKNKLWKHEHKERRAECNSTDYEKNYAAIADKKKRKYWEKKENKAKINEKANTEVDAEGSKIDRKDNQKEKKRLKINQV